MASSRAATWNAKCSLEQLAVYPGTLTWFLLSHFRSFDPKCQGWIAKNTALLAGSGLNYPNISHCRLNIYIYILCIELFFSCISLAFGYSFRFPYFPWDFPKRNATSFAKPWRRIQTSFWTARFGPHRSAGSGPEGLEKNPLETFSNFIYDDSMWSQYRKPIIIIYV